ncbi:MAG: hypothetical protein AAF961_15520, partial [Planctomycetota bacterium]
MTPPFKPTPEAVEAFRARQASLEETCDEPTSAVYDGAPGLYLDAHRICLGNGDACFQHASDALKG